MNCPRCGKNIGGFVEANSLAARRVSEGKCPHCGRSMPRGYRVSFKESRVPRRKRIEKYSTVDVERENRHSPYRIFCMCLEGAAVIVFGALNGMLLWGLIIGILLILTGLVYYRLLGFNTIDVMNPRLSLTKPRSAVVASAGWVIGFIVCILFSAGFFRNGAGRLPGQLIWILIVFGFTRFVTIRGSRLVLQENESRKRSGVSDYAINMLKAEAGFARLKCGLCGRILDNREAFGASVDGSSAAVVCMQCLRKANPARVGSSAVEVGGKVFYIVK